MLFSYFNLVREQKLNSIKALQEKVVFQQTFKSSKWYVSKQKFLEKKHNISVKNWKKKCKSIPQGDDKRRCEEKLKHLL